MENESIASDADRSREVNLGHQSDEKSPLLGNDQYSVNYDTTESYQSKDRQKGVYKRRWYILVVFSFTAFMQSMTWNTWGPIADTVESVLPGWSNSDIGLLTNWGPIAYVISALPFSWLMDVKGMRVSVLITQSLLMVGMALRCIPVPIGYLKWTMNLGQMFIGLAGPVLMAGPPLISVTWFPPHERTTATAFSTVCAYFGVAASFLLGPLIVEDLPDNSTGVVTVGPINNGSLGVSDDISQTEIDEIWHLMYIECGMEGLLFLMTIIYFPKKPPLPPSISAGTQRIDFKAGIFKLAKSSQLWFLGLAYGIAGGTFCGWGTILVLLLSPLGVSQEEAGWIGFWGNIAGAAAGLIIARFVDCIGGRIKVILIVLFSGAMLSFGWYLLLCYQLIAFNTVMLYASIIALGVLINGAIPLFYEGAVEATYPIAEGITTITLTWLNNFFGLLFLLILTIPSEETAWMNWCMLGAIVISMPLLILFKERHNRLAVDLTPDPPEFSGDTAIQS
ncbi:solute carrier family 49 member 4 homolog isoform X2 [Ptychodera flava]|uniref:solute carrier family 49 member 4 homolog isoform X2 n=1 Tax=Ptychodera flava TaxID=63121 RepID=UPI003969C7A2